MSTNSGSQKKITISSRSRGIRFAGALFLLFLALKLCHVIDWSWWWVFSPLWGAAGIVIVVLLVLLTIAIIAGEFK